MPSFLNGEGMGLNEVGYVMCFEPMPKAVDVAVAVIFGEKGARGRVPACGGNVFPENNSSK